MFPRQYCTIIIMYWWKFEEKKEQGSSESNLGTEVTKKYISEAQFVIDHTYPTYSSTHKLKRRVFLRNLKHIAGYNSMYVQQY